MLFNSLLNKALQRYWRISRGMTLGVQGLVLGKDGRVLLVRHTYRPGWHFPGGGVERHETAEQALARELKEEAGVIVSGPAELFGLYANFRAFPSDHVALYMVRHWDQPHIPRPNHEIAAQAFFRRDALPPDLGQGAHRRILEVLDGAPRSVMW
ncbi:MAG: NUDIX domain-containing protein [Hyphomicrobium sp.]